jgi:photosystem II stability/assembly factor-like uncharacterized protein
MKPVRMRLAVAVAVLAPSLAMVTAVVAQQAPVPTPPELRMQWWRAHEAMEASSLMKAANWQFIGPTNMSGRATDAAVVQPKGASYTMYVAQATGGVWKSTNEGITWQPVFDQGPSTSIGDVTVAPSDQDIVWIGTGEANIFRSSNTGAGVWKSTDAGATFEHMGLVSTGTIARILIDPGNPDIVWVAAAGMEWSDNPDRGVFKSTNGGRTWEKVLYVDERTGAIDLLMHPGDPNTLYAATWQRIRLKWHDPRNEPDYQHSGIWKSTDGGRNWQQINEGLPEAVFRGRIGIDISRSNPDVLYAYVDNYEIARQPEAGQTDAYGRPAGPVIKGATVYRSDNAGASWYRVSAEDRFMESASGTYGWVFGQIRVDPNDPDKVYFMGIRLHVSADGGRTWNTLTGMHVDHHGLWIDPANSDYLLNNNDGGTYVSYDGGANWRFFVDIPAVQFFNVQYDMAEPFNIYGSIQDHGSRRGRVDLRSGRDNIPPVDFDNAPGGEGSNHAVDPRDPSIVYSAGFYGSINRTNVSTGESADITPGPPQGEVAYRGQWLAPFIISPHNPNVLYHGFNVMHRSMDRGDTWERISDDLTYNDSTKYGDIPYQTIFSISESPVRFGLLYAGTDDGRVHVTRDGGRNWSELASALPRGKFIAELVASQYDEGTVYMAQNGKREDDHAPYLWKSTDYGMTWTSISDGIPIGPINVVREDPSNASVLYVGTDIGVYVSIDGGEAWHALANGLPSTYVHDLVIHPRDDMMVVATHGRGIHALDVRPIQQLTREVTGQPVAVLAQSEPAMLSRGGRGPFGGPSIPARTYYWLGSAGTTTITIRNSAGAVVRELSGTGDAGLNAVMWDLRSGEAGPAAGGGGRGGRGGGFGGGAAPGLYTVEVVQGSNRATGWVHVSG